jgi:hypothetical protein
MREEIDYDARHDPSPEDHPEPAAPAKVKRRAPTKTEKLAATLLMLKTADPVTGEQIPVIDPKWAETVSAQEIVDRFEKWNRWDHTTPHFYKPGNHPSNLVPLPRQHHEAVKTPKDQKDIAKTKRLMKKHDQFVRSLFAKAKGEPPPPPVKKKAKMQSRGFAATRKSKWKKKMDGSVVPRLKGI